MWLVATILGSTALAKMFAAILFSPHHPCGSRRLLHIKKDKFKCYRLAIAFCHLLLAL